MFEFNSYEQSVVDAADDQGQLSAAQIRKLARDHNMNPQDLLEEFSHWEDANPALLPVENLLIFLGY
jgi:hypothetical protein